MLPSSDYQTLSNISSNEDYFSVQKSKNDTLTASFLSTHENNALPQK